MKSLFLLLVMALTLPVSSVMSQNSGLTQDELNEVSERTKQMLNDFQGNLMEIGDKSNDDDFKNFYIKETLKMFLGNGESYELTNSNGYAVTHQPVTMQTSSLRNGVETKSKKTMKEYLNRLKRLPYQQVTIEQSDVVRISNLYRVGNHYEATASFYQYFRGEGKYGETKYADNTKKNVRVVVYFEPDEDGGKWVVKFGDMTVSETRRVR